MLKERDAETDRKGEINMIVKVNRDTNRKK